MTPRSQARLCALAALVVASAALAPIVEPYAALHGGRFIPGHGALANPDPLRDYVWDLADLPPGPNTSLQLFSVLPVATTADPSSAFSGLPSLIRNASGDARALASGTLRVDFGTELAAWLELRSPDLTLAALAAGCLSMSVSESTTPQFFAPSRLVRILAQHSLHIPSV
jgi:hypothetical protein